jgi:uncharacterized BrkB/YihY/UPF0761 family membrane protein
LDQRGLERRLSVVRALLFLAAVAAVTAVLVLPVPDYDGITGGRARHEDALLSLGFWVLVLAVPLVAVALIVTVIYWRWPNRWSRRFYYVLLFFVAVANAVGLVTGAWLDVLTDCDFCMREWLVPHLLIAASLFIALAPAIKRFRSSAV